MRHQVQLGLYSQAILRWYSKKIQA